MSADTQGTGTLTEGNGLIQAQTFSKARRKAANEGVASRCGINCLDNVGRVMMLAILIY